MTTEHKELPEFTAKLLTEMAFAYSRWSKYISKLEDKHPEVAGLISETHKARYFILMVLLLAGQKEPGGEVSSEDVWPRVQKDKRLAEYCKSVVMQYAEEVSLFNGILTAITPKDIGEEEARLMKDQLFMVVVLMLMNRKTDFYTLSGAAVKELVSSVAGIVIKGFKEYSDDPSQLDKALEGLVKSADAAVAGDTISDSDIKRYGPGYVHKGGNA